MQQGLVPEHVLAHALHLLLALLHVVLRVVGVVRLLQLLPEARECVSKLFIFFSRPSILVYIKYSITMD